MQIAKPKKPNQTPKWSCAFITPRFHLQSETAAYCTICFLVFSENVDIYGVVMQFLREREVSTIVCASLKCHFSMVVS